MFVLGLFRGVAEMLQDGLLSLYEVSCSSDAKVPGRSDIPGRVVLSRLRASDPDKKTSSLLLAELAYCKNLQAVAGTSSSPADRPRRSIRVRAQLS